MHWNHTEVIDGIPYVTVGSLVEVRLSGGAPAGGFAEVALEDGGRLVVEVPALRARLIGASRRATAGPARRGGVRLERATTEK
jgi:hypothetical protein